MGAEDSFAVCIHSSLAIDLRYPVTTAEYIVNDVCDVRWMSAVWSMQERVSQVEGDVHETSKNGTRRIATTAGTRRRVASQVYLARGHVVTDIIDVFQATTANHAGCRGSQSDQKVPQSTEIAEVYVQIAHDHFITIGDLNTKKVLHRRQGTTATSVNVDHSSENDTRGTLEAVDTDAAVDSSWVSVHTENRRREPCGLGPLHGLRPPRLPAKWFPLHHPGPATTNPLMRGRPVRGLHALTPFMISSREFRLALSPPPVRRYDQGQPLATPGSRRVGAQVTPEPCGGSRPRYCSSAPKFKTRRSPYAQYPRDTRKEWWSSTCTSNPTTQGTCWFAIHV
ncbi:hypothetical protein MRX96_046087 [Rhipicephalus microplus]